VENPAEDAVAGVRLADGAHAWVEGCPDDLAEGASIYVHISPADVVGIVIVPPRLVMWRDPDVVCHRFSGMHSEFSGSTLNESPPTIASFQSENCPDDSNIRNEMLALAHLEIGRLDG